jgi:hypothetical protein
LNDELSGARDVLKDLFVLDGMVEKRKQTKCYPGQAWLANASLIIEREAVIVSEEIASCTLMILIRAIAAQSPSLGRFFIVKLA